MRIRSILTDGKVRSAGAGLFNLLKFKTVRVTGSGPTIMSNPIWAFAALLQSKKQAIVALRLLLTAVGSERITPLFLPAHYCTEHLSEVPLPPAMKNPPSLPVPDGTERYGGLFTVATADPVSGHGH